MEHSEVRDIVMEEVSRQLRHTMMHTTCPSCKAETIMLRYWNMSDDNESNMERRYRCVACLKVFSREFVEKEI